jgi:hypothetical protein
MKIPIATRSRDENFIVAISCAVVVSPGRPSDSTRTEIGVVLGTVVALSQ